MYHRNKAFEKKNLVNVIENCLLRSNPIQDVPRRMDSDGYHYQHFSSNSNKYSVYEYYQLLYQEMIILELCMQI
jgi:hypothetical protein